jgi:hypothetical protein
LLEPAESPRPRRPAAAGDAGSREPIEVCVVGACPGCGVSTVASGLRLVLDSPVVERSHVVTDPVASVVLVTPGSGHPPIAELLASLLRERVAHLLLVANRVSDENRWNGLADACLPESRFGAALTARGRHPPGSFGVALRQLGALVAQGVAV